MLDEEFLTFLTNTFPYFNEKMVTVPISFQYNLGNQHGAPDKAKEIRKKKLAEEEEKHIMNKQKTTVTDNREGGKQKKKKRPEKKEEELLHDWHKAAHGQMAEQKVFEMLQKRFSNEPCLLVHQFKESDLVRVIQENLDQKRRDAKLKNSNSVSGKDLTESEFQLSKVTNRHYYDFEEQIIRMMDQVIKESFCEDSIPQILDKIREDKPGYDLLTESQRKNYMKNIGDFLNKKFKEGAVYRKGKLQDLILKHFLDLTYPNTEYDLLLFLKVCQFFAIF